LSETVTIRLLPLGAQFAVGHDSALHEPLTSFGMEFPCGGEGWCGSCKVRVLEGALRVTPEDQSALTEEELAAGCLPGARDRPPDTRGGSVGNSYPRRP